MVEDFVLFVAVGFAAQLVDGAIGMAYGLSGTSVMLSLGIPPATASASVHAAEVFTTGISGFSHWHFGNVDWAFVRRLALPGMLGGAIGAYLLTTIPGDSIAPFMNAYLLIMGAWILWKAFQHRPTVSEPPRWIMPLGFGGGFLDAIGGGGWGPMVTSTLLGHGTTPRFTIGSVNFTNSSSPRSSRRLSLAPSVSRPLPPGLGMECVVEMPCKGAHLAAAAHLVRSQSYSEPCEQAQGYRAPHLIPQRPTDRTKQ